MALHDDMTQTNATESPMNMFDRFIDHFSARELKSRVWGVVLIGFVLMAVAGLAGWWLLTHEFFVASEPGLERVRFIKLLTKGI